MSAPKLADLTQAVLDPPTVATLFDDLESCTNVLAVLTKGGATLRTNPRNITLREAEALLVGGKVQAVQVQYVFEDQQWRDTLMRRPDGVQLVRMQMDFE